ncbi:MAG: orotate phosphoribosyltransferase, partial [Enterococcus aquimarinus]
FTYELPKGLENFKAAEMPLITLTNYTTLLESAVEANYIEEKDLTLLANWKKDPVNWLN